MSLIRVNIQNIKRTTTQRQPNSKIGKGLQLTLLQRRYTKEQHTHKQIRYFIRETQIKTTSINTTSHTSGWLLSKHPENQQSELELTGIEAGPERRIST
jgi:hypothetical protein